MKEFAKQSQFAKELICCKRLEQKGLDDNSQYSGAKKRSQSKPNIWIPVPSALLGTGFMGMTGAALPAVKGY